MTDQTYKKPPLRWLAIPALLLALAAISFTGITLLGRAAYDYYEQRYLDFSFSADGYSYAETTEELDNPGGGFYCLHGYLLSEDTTDEALGGLLARDISLNESKRLVLLEINLLRYRDAPLSGHALAQLEQILCAWEEADFQIILRFLYDWDGNATATEPKELAQIKEHMTQTAPVVNAHAASIYTMQGIFVGCWGEMHGSVHMKTEPMCELMEHLNKVIDPGIFLAVRTPAQRRTILNSIEPFPAGNDLAPRLGLYNDGMLGSKIDLGTYGDVDKNASTALTDRWLRAQELEYQDLCRFVPNGGEVTIDNPLNDLDAAVESLCAMHVSYLNCKYQSEVLDKWRAGTIHSDDGWSGMDGFTYIERHMGARYRCTGVKAGTFDYWTKDEAALSLSLCNTAFCGSYQPLAFKLRVVSDADGSVVMELTLGTDNGNLQSMCNGELSTVSAVLPLRGISDGSYRVCLSCEYTHGGQAVALANSLPRSGHGYEIASFTLERTPTGTPSGKELIERYLSHLSGSGEAGTSAK